MRAEYINKDSFEAILRLMGRENALALEVSVLTGLRIGDVLKIAPGDLREGWLYYTAQKTKKRGKKPIGLQLQRRLLQNSRNNLCFPGRSGKKPRTRQAVFRDLQKACAAFSASRHISPHSARKIYAADLYRKTDLATVQKELQHTDPGTTLLYVDPGKREGLTEMDFERIRYIIWECLYTFFRDEKSRS